MSDSTREKKTHAKRGQGPGRTGPFMVTSFALHIGALSLLMFYSPTREAIFGKSQPKPPESRLDPEALANLTEQIRDINREKLISAAIEVQSNLAEMEELRQEIAKEFSSVAQSRYEGSLQQLQDTLKKVVTAQQEALAEQGQSRSADESLNGHRDAAARKQSDAEAGQQSLTDLLEYGGADAELKKQQDAANAAQIQATRTFAAARQAASSVRNAQQRGKQLAEQLPREQEAVANEQRALEAAVTAKNDAQAKLDAGKGALDAAQQQLAAAEATTKPTDKNAARQLADQVKRDRDAAKRAQQEVDRLNRTLAEAAKNVQRREESLTKVQERLATAQQAADTAAKQATEAQPKFDTKLEEAIKLQEQAKALQEKANQAVAEAIAANALKGPQAPDAPQVQTGISLSRASVGQIYEQLVKSEKDMAEGYREFRATDLAMLTGVSPRRAAQQIDVPLANRPAIDRALTEKKITENQDYQQHAEAVQTALRESESIVTATRNMLDQAYAARNRGEHGANVTLEARSRRMAEIAKASHEEMGGQVADLSHLMQQAAAPANPGEPDKSDIPARPIRNPQRPPAIRDVDVSRAARTITASASSAKWVYVDSWYTVGPFANPGRANIHRSFAPESTINLDAVYEGMFGPERWRFVQSARPMVQPPNAVEYGIWYAYTEVRFDEACDVWIAVGSDDRSDIWINDLRVWSSSDALKGWQIGEGLRRVRFEKGRNRILYRLENGWNTCGFSLCIYVGEGNLR